jgi:hypothetical protein
MFQVSFDEAEQKLYTLTKPATGDHWPLKQYSCVDGLNEVNAVTLVTSHFLRNMQVVAGHVVFFKQPKEDNSINNNNSMPAVFNLASIPWGGSLNLESGMQLPGHSFHFSHLLLGRDCMYVVSKNAHVTWTRSDGGNYSEATHQSYAEARSRPVVVHKLTGQSGTFQVSVAGRSRPMPILTVF